MSFLRSLLFPSPALQCYALLDARGHCRAFKECRQAPATPGWVHINEIRLNWLGAPLPCSARVCAPAPARQQAAAWGL